MKKRNLIVTIALAIVLCFIAVGCSNLGTVTIKGKQDYSYIVLSNGGSAVQYGNYVYFLNGYKDFDDDKDAKQNVFNKVTKGAVYRAKLLGEDQNKTFNFSFGTTTQKTFLPIKDSETLLSIKTNKRTAITGYETLADGSYQLDENGDYIARTQDFNDADVQLIAPKLAGTSDYSEGGIFIFDNYLFYATPSNKKDKSGTTQTHKTEFYRAKLDGSETKLIYTTKNDSTSSPYMFYKFKGSYYLVALDGTNAISVKMGKKINDPVTIAKDVQQLYLPNKGVYYKNMPENTVEDFVFILRSAKEGDPSRIGNVIEMKRPDGSVSQIISANGTSPSIIGANEGTFYMSQGGKISYSNYAHITNGLLHKNGDINVDAVLPSGVRDIYGSFKFDPYATYDVCEFVLPNPMQNLNAAFAIASNTDGLFTLNADGEVVKTIYSSLSTIIKIEGSYVYFTASAAAKNGQTHNMLMRADMFSDSAIEVLISTDGVNSSTPYTYDILNDYVVYYSDVDSLAKAYAFFKAFDDAVTLDELKSMTVSEVDKGLFVGKPLSSEMVDEDDLYPDED